MGRGDGKGDGKGEGKGGFFGLLEEVGNCIKCILCLPVVGFILLIIGAVVLGSMANDTRTHDLNEWNDAIDVWQSTRRSEYDSMSLRSSLGSDSFATMTQDMSQDHIEDNKKSGDPEWKYPYTFLKYEESVSVTLGASNSFGVEAGNQSLSIPFDTTSTQTKSDSELNCYTTSRSSSSSSKCRTRNSNPSSKWCSCSDACNNEGGLYTSNRCSISTRIKEVCVRITETGQLDTGLSGSDQGGCEYAGDSWSKAKYEVCSGGSCGTTQTVTLTVRSKYDPWIKAQDLTKGSLNFGLTTREKFVLGTALLVVGSLLFCLPLGVACWFCKSRQESRSRPMQYSSQPPAIQTSYVQPQVAPASRVVVPQQQVVVQGTVVQQQQPVITQGYAV